MAKCDLSVRVTVELAIPCPKSGPRVFKGFTVGFHPRSSELVMLADWLFLFLGILTIISVCFTSNFVTLGL